jgi:hypothetical protein
VRQIESSLTDPDEFADESREVLEDELGPLADEVRRSVSRSRLLRAGAPDAGLTVVSGVATASGLAIAGVAPAVGIVGAAGSAIGRWLLGTLFPKQHSGARSAVAHIVRSTSSTGGDPLRRSGGIIFIDQK